MNGEQLEKVNSLKYLRATLPKDDYYIADIRIATETIARLDSTWRDNTKRFAA